MMIIIISVLTPPRVPFSRQNDDADQQMPGSSSRDMGDQGCVLVKGCEINTHRGFEVKVRPCQERSGIASC
jgi:hypothetical protein